MGPRGPSGPGPPSYADVRSQISGTEWWRNNTIRLLLIIFSQGLGSVWFSFINSKVEFCLRIFLRQNKCCCHRAVDIIGLSEFILITEKDSVVHHILTSCFKPYKWKPNWPRPHDRQTHQINKHSSRTSAYYIFIQPVQITCTYYIWS